MAGCVSCCWACKRCNFSSRKRNSLTGLELEVGEVLPVVNDQKILLDIASDFVSVQTCAASNHLPEFDPTEYRLGENEVLDRGYINTCIEHIYRDSYTRHGLVLEVVQR